MDTILGTVDLNKRQIERLTTLRGGNILGFGLRGDKLIAVTINELNDLEKNDLLILANNLDGITPTKNELDGIEINNIKSKLDDSITLQDVIKVLRNKKIL